MKCPSCGTKNEKGSRFCKNCGALLESESFENIETTSETIEAKSPADNDGLGENMNFEKTASSGFFLKKPIKVLLIFAVIILAAVLLLVVLGKMAPDREEPESSSEIVSAESAESEAVVLFAPYKAEACAGKNRSDVVRDFKKAGFQNIKEEAVEDLDADQKAQKNTVETVIVDDNLNFDETNEFSEASVVVVRYHDFKKVKSPISPEDAKRRETGELEDLFKEAGFAEISKEEIIDLDPDEAADEFENEIRINGKASFSSEEVFSVDSAVKIITHRAYNKYDLNLEVEFVSNWFFNKYDVYMRIADNEQRLQHGKGGAFSYRLKEGEYTLEFTGTDPEYNTKGKLKIDLTGDTNVGIEIACNDDEISITTKYYENNGAVGENEVMAPGSAADLVGENYETVKRMFADAGFTNVKTKALYDITWGITDEGAVDSVLIGENAAFIRGDVFGKDEPILIIYHMKEEDDPNKPKEETENSGHSSSGMDKISYHSSGSREMAKQGNSGVYAYISKDTHDDYIIIDFDEKFVYFFSGENEGHSYYYDGYIYEGSLNEYIAVVLIKDDEPVLVGLNFKRVGTPDILEYQTEIGITFEFTTTNLQNALKIKARYN